MINWDCVIISLIVCCIFAIFLALVAIVTKIIASCYYEHKKRKIDMKKRITYCKNALKAIVEFFDLKEKKDEK